jgi:hypothetical protein
MKALPVNLTVATTLVLALVSGLAQTTNMSELRALRVACIESFSTARIRLDELHGFVEQQAEREHAAADQLFQLKQNAASASRRNRELQQHARQATNSLERARKSLEQSTASYRAALEAMPNGEPWAQEGSAALNELRRAADAAPRDTWKHKRVREIEGEFVETLHQWRAARRAMERAGFDLELRAAPGAFKDVARQIDLSVAELKKLDGQLAERQATVIGLSDNSERWGVAIRSLEEGEYQARERLAESAFEFHLVDLRFAAWRLKHSNLQDEGIEALPDVLERSVGVTRIPGAAPADSASAAMPDSASFGVGGANPRAEGEEAAAAREEEGDTAFREVLARVTLAQARLRFLAEALEAEFKSVEAAIGLLESSEDQARTLAQDTAQVAAEQEALRRAMEKEQQTLARGEGTLELVKKRFGTDLKDINQLLQAASEKTAALAKNLGG